MNSRHRIAATIVALSAWAGLLIQLSESWQRTGSPAAAAWAMLEYFTILTNLLTAVVFTALALDRTRLRSAWIVAGMMLSMLLVGVTYNLVLRDIPVEIGLAGKIANELLHVSTPLLAALYWIFFEEKGQLRWKHIWLWAAYPLLYLVYALVRGSATGHYPYPFINVAHIGWGNTLCNAAVIAFLFAIAGALMVWIDSIASRRRIGSAP